MLVTTQMSKVQGQQRRPPMPIPVAVMMLSASLLVADTGGVPNLDVAPSCRDAASLGDSLNARFKQCMDDEHDALNELATKWSQFRSNDRASCLAAEGDVAGLSSYVELLECLNMAQEAGSGDPMTGSGGNEP
jgi:hypothetical protein